MMFRFIVFILFAAVFNSQVTPPADENQVKRLLILYANADDMGWNADGTLIATGTFGTVRMWDAQTLEQRYYVRQRGILNGIQFNDAGDRFLTWSYSEIRVWETETGRLFGTLVAPSNGEFDGVVWYGNRVLTWFGGAIGLWDDTSPDYVAEVLVPGESFTSFSANISWNRERTRFLTWNAIYEEIPVVRAWAVEGELDDITQLLSLQHDDEWIDGAVWSPDETMISSWSQRMVKIWDAQTGDLLHVLNADSYVTDARWSPNSRHILIEDINEGAARIWNAHTGEEVLTVPNTDAMWDTTGDRLLVGRQTITLVDVATGDTLTEFGPDLGLGYGLWNSDGIRLLVETAFGVQVWIIPPQDQCVVHALAPANLRAEPSIHSDRIDILPLRQLALVTGQTTDANNVIWWQLANRLWVRSDIVEETGRCSTSIPSD